MSQLIILYVRPPEDNCKSRFWWFNIVYGSAAVNSLSDWEESWEAEGNSGQKWGQKCNSWCAWWSSLQGLSRHKQSVNYELNGKVLAVSTTFKVCLRQKAWFWFSSLNNENELLICLFSDGTFHLLTHGNPCRKGKVTLSLEHPNLLQEWCWSSCRWSKAAIPARHLGACR